jgi:hypothetical protein
MKKVFFAMMMVAAVALSGCELWHSWSNWETVHRPATEAEKRERAEQERKNGYSGLSYPGHDADFEVFTDDQTRTCSGCGAVERRNINTPVK